MEKAKVTELETKTKDETVTETCETETKEEVEEGKMREKDEEEKETETKVVNNDESESKEVNGAVGPMEASHKQDGKVEEEHAVDHSPPSTQSPPPSWYGGLPELYNAAEDYSGSV